MKDLRYIFSHWKKATERYRESHSKNRIGFPEPLQKDIIIQYFDSSLVKDSGVYDFLGNVELKSSTTYSGCTPFSKNQIACSRILYMEIDANRDEIRIYELALSDVKKINNNNLNNNFNQSIGIYKVNASTPVILNM